MEHYLQDTDAFACFILSIIYIKSFLEARPVSGDQETKLCVHRAPSLWLWDCPALKPAFTKHGVLWTCL